MEPSLDRLMEGRQFAPRTFLQADVFAGLNPFLDCEELAALDEAQELCEVFWQPPVWVSHWCVSLRLNARWGGKQIRCGLRLRASATDDSFDSRSGAQRRQR